MLFGSPIRVCLLFYHDPEQASNRLSFSITELWFIYLVEIDTALRSVHFGPSETSTNVLGKLPVSMTLEEIALKLKGL